VVRWRRAQIVLWSAQHMDVPAIAKVAFTSEDRFREVIHNFNADRFDSLAPSTPEAGHTRSPCPRTRQKRSPSGDRAITALQTRCLIDTVAS
jgi:hypothetical protein